MEQAITARQVCDLCFILRFCKTCIFIFSDDCFLKVPDDLSYFPPIVIKPQPDGKYFDEMIDINQPRPTTNGTISAGGSKIL